MKHQTGGTGWPSGNILDFYAGLPEVWGLNPGGEKKFVCVYLPPLSYKCYVAVYYAEHYKTAVQSECTMSQGLGLFSSFCVHRYAQSDTVNSLL